jgi:hypothetical protein
MSIPLFKTLSTYISRRILLQRMLRSTYHRTQGRENIDSIGFLNAEVSETMGRV